MTAVMAWLRTFLPTVETMSRDDAARLILEREVRFRYAPTVVEFDQVLASK